MCQQVELGKLSCVSEDARRAICEFTFKESGGAFQDFLIRDGSKPLGQHFHRLKEEIFYFLEGSGIIHTALVDKNGKITGPVKKFEVSKGSVIRITPNQAHRFDLEPNTRFVAYSSKPFDPNDMVACPIEV